jgi:hypothetical protein
MSLSLPGHSTSDHRKVLHEEFRNCDQLSASGYNKEIVNQLMKSPIKQRGRAVSPATGEGRRLAVAPRGCDGGERGATERPGPSVHASG